jgi:C-terminal processing protease CtpA/Prc
MKSVLFVAGTVIGLLFTSATGAADHPMSQGSYAHEDEVKLPSGVIGVSLQVGAERIGDPAMLYVGMVHPEGPAQQAGLAHGDEILSVNGMPVAGKTYEEVVKMIRGEAGTVVKLSVKAEGAPREISITRIASEKLPRGPKGSHGASK